jgi:hypothetical protein
MTKETDEKEVQQEQKKKKPTKKPTNNQTSGVSFTLGDRAKIRWNKS